VRSRCPFIGRGRQGGEGSGGDRNGGPLIFCAPVMESGKVTGGEETGCRGGGGSAAGGRGAVTLARAWAACGSAMWKTMATGSRMGQKRVAWLQAERPKLLGLSGIKIKKEKKTCGLPKVLWALWLGLGKNTRKGLYEFDLRF
jgi:hypothetical protein